jgi:hypothetical protein
MKMQRLLLPTLLVGAALNFIGGAKFLVAAHQTASGVGASDEYLLFKLFTAGTAAVFGSLYVCLCFHPSYVVPFLAFGASLKTWALLISLYLFARNRLSLRTLLEFGVSNGVVAVLFWICVFTAG